MNQKMEELKKEYENITPPEGYERRMQQLLQERGGKTKKGRQNFHIPAVIAASFLIFITGALNVSPAFAETVSKVPGFSGIVKILTLSRYEVQENGMEATIVTPKIEGLLNQELQERLNAEFAEHANEVIAAFEQELKQMQQEHPEETFHMRVDSGFAVKTDTEEYFAIDLYLERTEGSSAATHKFYTINKKRNTIVSLEGLFQKDAEYIDVISAYIQEEMRRQNAAGEAAYFIDSEYPEDGFVKIKEDQNFYINEKGELVICFDEYEVGPGAMGSVEFVIPDTIIADLLTDLRK